jgi:hypothetical protein
MTDANEAAPQVRWDRSRFEELSSALVAARAKDDYVVIDFGDLLRGGAEGEEQSARLRRRIALQPVAAKHLCDMLGRLVAEGGVRMDDPK